ncbi:MAG: hypothetical protein DMG07_01775 [Acidobacteria bacterium]|nr:MAG: hypothetical protein DMG07_01775 [Acidobacteriota bacterium]
MIASAVDLTSTQPVSVVPPANPNIVWRSSRRLSPPPSVRVTGLFFKSAVSYSSPLGRKAVIVRITGDAE